MHYAVAWSHPQAMYVAPFCSSPVAASPTAGRRVKVMRAKKKQRKHKYTIEFSLKSVFQNNDFAIMRRRFHFAPLLLFVCVCLLMPGVLQRIACSNRRNERSRSADRRGVFGYGYELTNWLQEWAWGTIFASSLVRKADAKVKGGDTSNPHVCRLAKSVGCVQNAERIVESIIPTSRFPPLQTWAGTVKDGILPYDSFHWLKELNATKFEIAFGARGDLTQWWTDFRASGDGLLMWNLHPWLRHKIPADLSRHVPLMLFDDAGVVGKAKSAFCRVYYSLVGKGSDKETRALLATAHKFDYSDDRSWDPIMESFAKLALPVDRDSWGGILLFLGCDLEYVCNVCGMTHFNSNDVCGLCEANDSSHPHTDNGRGAAWRDSSYTNDAYVAKFRRPLHALVRHEWFSKYSYRLDVMHLADHHGVANHVVGNVFYAQICDPAGPLPGNSQQARLDFLNDDIRGYNSLRAVQSRLPRLKMDNIIVGDFPELRGTLVKAANSRQVVPYAVDLARRARAKTGTDPSKHAFKCVDTLHRIYDLLYNAGTFLTPDEKRELERLCFKMGIHYQWLAVNAADNRQLRWKQNPKHHLWFGHLTEQAQLINPIVCQGYCSESMVGSLACIYKGSMRGPHHGRSATTVLKKWCTGKILDLVR